METETYQIQPKNGSNIQELAREGSLIALREELGLPPMKLKEKNSDLFRFRKLTEEEATVFKVLFPKQTKIENYEEFIPEEALQAISEFNETCPYKVVENPEVWHAKEYDPDPVLTVGVRTVEDEYSFANAVYLIARWGEALLPFSELKAQAFEKWKTVRLTNLRKIRREVETLILETEDAEALLNSKMEPYFHDQ